MHFGWARRRVSLNSEPGTRGVETYAPVAMVESKPQNRQAQHGIEQGNLQEAASIHIRICICLSIWSLHNNGNTLSARRPSLHQDHRAHWLEGSSNVRRIPSAIRCHAMPCLSALGPCTWAQRIQRAWDFLGTSRCLGHSHDQELQTSLVPSFDDEEMSKPSLSHKRCTP
jgi:hypothetical protein